MADARALGARGVTPVRVQLPALPPRSSKLRPRNGGAGAWILRQLFPSAALARGTGVESLGLNKQRLASFAKPQMEATTDKDVDQLAKRRMHVFAVLLVLIGAGAWFVVRPLLGPSSAAWDAQVTQDAVSLTQLLRYDLRVEDAGAVEAAWEKRRALYDAEHLADLRDRLNTFLDFQVREYGQAKSIYLSGTDPARHSTGELALNDQLRRGFGEAAAGEMLRQYGERVREAAYKASPKVGGQPDPEAPRYDEMYDDVVKDWLPQARAAVERLTSPTR